MQLVLVPQTARLARAVEVPLADLLPVDRKCRSNVIQVAVSIQALGTALFLLLDHLFSRAAAGDALNIDISERDNTAQLSFQLARTAETLPLYEESELAVRCTRKHFPRPKRWLGRNLNGTHSRIPTRDSDGDRNVNSP